MECTLKTQSNEIWKDVVGWEGVYMVSDLGRVRSLGRKIVHSNGFVQTIHEKIMKGSLTAYGYRAVDLCNGKIRKNSAVHRLVLSAFVGLMPRDIDTRHIDGNRLNNNLKNLKYGTRQDNVNDCKRHGRIPSGDSHWNVKVSNREATEILKSTSSNAELADKYGVSWACIYDIRKGNRIPTC